MSNKKGVLRGARGEHTQTHGGVCRFRSRHSIAISIERRMDHKPDTRSRIDDVAKVSQGPVPEVSRAICLVRYTYTRLWESW